MEALAEATCRSACAMSGRRSSRVEGIPTGIAGGPNSPFVYIVDEGNKRISKFNISGAFVSNFAPSGSQAFGLPIRVAPPLDGHPDLSRILVARAQEMLS